MVLTITVVGNNQANNNPGHAVLSPNDLAQLMSGQTMTGLLNPDGSITLNSNVAMPGNQTLASIPSTTQSNGPQPISSSTGQTYSPQFRVQSDSMTNATSSSISSLPASTNNLNTTPHASIPSVNNTTNVTSNQKKTPQKRLSAKQKLALQQQQQQQQQQQNQAHQLDSSGNRHIMTPQSDQSINQQPQIVATVQLPNGQIGQLIAPSGGQFWSPNAINLQQLSMAVAAATGTMPQTMSIPPDLSHSGQQPESPSLQQQNQLQNDQPQSSTQQQTSQSLVNSNQQQLVTTVQLPNNQIGQIVNRPNSGQFWPGGPISLTQLSALAQQGVVQLSPVQGLPTTGTGNQRVVELIPHASIQGLFGQNGQNIQTISLANNGQFITQDPNDSEKWQLVGSNQISSSQPTNPIPNCGGNAGSVSNAQRNVNQFVNSSQSTNLHEGVQTAQPQRKLKRLACTCPNCRDGDNSRNNGDKKKQHICHFPDCNKVYGKTSHLRAHLRWHSGERPYVCHWSFCGKKFTRSDELQRHRRTHTGEKRFQCNECLKRFMRSDHLSKHLKTHLSTKKSTPNHVQLNNGMPTIVTLAQNSNQMEEGKMIDDAALESMEQCNNKSETDNPLQDPGQNVNNSLVKLES